LTNEIGYVIMPSGVRMPQINKDQPGFDPLTDNPLIAEQKTNSQDTKIEKPLSDKRSDLLDLKSPITRIATAVITLALIVIVVLIMRNFFLPKTPLAQAKSQNPGPIPTVNVNLSQPYTSELLEVSYSGGVPRLAQLHTIIPERPRDEIEKYTVVQGDTVFGIAEKFGLKPETILWGNYFTLLDNPSFLQPGQILNILPVDGIYHKWNAGDGLNGVSEFFGVKPEDIINYPLNHLDIKTIGDLSNPNIEQGTMLVVPNGKRNFVTWSAPRITRDDPGVAKVLGPGYCGAITDGPVGIQVFIWPTNNHFLSGFDYSPETNHFGIDLDGETGDPIYATDNGVVVYSGWNDWGYGNMIVIDHGNGWQSLYGHLSQVNVGCGAFVYQGTVIGFMGSTGRSSGSHLHFELMNDSGKVNPHNYLP
jgi:LysM repeat protein